MKKFPLKQDPNAAQEAAKYTNPTASREYILQIIDALGAPLTFDDLAAALGIAITADEQNIALDRRLRAMLRDGQLVENRRGGLLPVDEKHLVRGTVQAHADGYGFLLLDEGGDDVFIHARQMDALFDGDQVIMRVISNKKGKTEGRLVDVLQRAHSHLVGQLFYEDEVAFLVPANKRISQDVLINPGKTMGAQHSQVVKVKITHQPTRRHQALGDVVEILGEAMAAGMEIKVALNTHHIEHEFSDAAMEQAVAHNREVSAKQRQGRVDYTALNLVTIDGKDAKDFDDAVYCQQTTNGYKLYVAIADVSHYLKINTPLDKEAAKRATSVYFPGQVIPMLPAELSNGICSLNPGELRLCKMCEMEIGHDGKILNSQFKNGYFISKARLTYQQVAAVISGKEHDLNNLVPDIENLYGVYKALKKARKKRGAIDFDSTETRIVFSADKKIKAILPLVRNDAHRIIEECMIAANICAAKFLKHHKINSLYRVHEQPEHEKYMDLRDFLAGFALAMPYKKQPTAADYARVLKQVKNKPEAVLIQTVLLRSMQQAVYLPSCQGHFGLSLANYTHFTSPIRRYPDLLVHRAIEHILQRQTAADFNYGAQQMADLADHCSTAERVANEAVRDVEDWLKCEFMLDKIGEQFAGIISGVTPFGIFVQLENVYVEGMVHVTNLPKDYYQFDGAGHRLLGEKTRVSFRLADRVEVKVAAVDLEERKIDLELVAKFDKPRRMPQKRAVVAKKDESKNEQK